MSRMGDASASNAGNAGTGEQGGGGGQADLAGAAQQVGQNLRELGSQARDVAQEQYSRLRQSATDYYSQGRERAVEWEQGLENYIHEKPIQAVLIAAGVGVLLGLLWKRS